MLEQILEQYDELGEISLIFALRHEIANFRKSFNLRIDGTVLLTPYASNMFGFGLAGELPAIGVPDALTQIYVTDPLTNEKKLGTLWDHFIRTRWYGVFAQPGTRALYLLLDFGKDPENRQLALRIEMRPKRIQMLIESGQVIFTRMTSSGMADPLKEYESFSLDVHTFESRFWEPS